MKMTPREWIVGCCSGGLRKKKRRKKRKKKEPNKIRPVKGELAEEEKGWDYGKPGNER
jgi:hypothetical protein